MEIDIQIKNATLEEVRGIFTQVPKGTEYKIVTVPDVDRREENLGRSVIPGDELTDSLTAETPPVLKKGVPAVVKKKPKKEAADEKYGIPRSLRDTDKKKYGRIYWRCRTKGMTYEEALKLEEKTAENVAECSAAPLQSDCNKITIAPGMYVKQIKPYKGSQILGTAIVLSRDGDLVQVRNGNKKKHTIDVSCLELAEALSKQPAPRPAAKKKGGSGKTLPCLYCKAEMNTRLLHIHARKEHAEQYDKSGLSAYIAGKNIIPPLKEVVEPFPSSPATGTTAVPPEEPPVMEAILPDEDPLDIHIEGAEGLEDNPDTLDQEIPDSSPTQDDLEEQPSPADETKAGDEGPQGQAPEQPGGLRRGQKVKHNGATSSPYFGQTGIVERVPPNLPECMVRFTRSTGWVPKTDLTLV